MLAQIIVALGRGFGELHVDFAIEQPQRIPFQPLMAILAQLREMRPAVIEQRRAKPRAAFRVAQRIDLEFQLEPKFAAQFVDHDDQFGVACGVGPPENLDAELMELAEAALLRTLAPEHRAAIVEALLGVAAIEARLDIRAHHARRAFGPQRERGLRLVAIGKGVHLFFDHVGSLAGRALIELDPLEQRDANLVDGVTFDDRARVSSTARGSARARPSNPGIL